MPASALDPVERQELLGRLERLDGLTPSTFERIEHRPGQQSSDTPDQPDRTAETGSHGGGSDRPGGSECAFGADRQRLEQDQVGLGDGARHAPRRHLGGVDVESLELAHDVGCLASDVDHQQLEVAAAGERCGTLLGPPHQRDDAPLGQRRSQMAGGRVGLELGGRSVRLAARVGRAQHAGTQPPQRGAGQLSVDDPTTGRDQSGVVVTKGAERHGRFLHQQVGGRPLGPGNEAEPLDRVHGRNIGPHAARTSAMSPTGRPTRPGSAPPAAGALPFRP